MSKKCFKCNKKKPLFLFDKRPEGVYTRPSDQGVSVSCKICSIKESFNNGGVFYKWSRKWEKQHPVIRISPFWIVIFHLFGLKTKRKLILSHLWIERTAKSRTEYFLNKLKRMTTIPV